MSFERKINLGIELIKDAIEKHEHFDFKEETNSLKHAYKSFADIEYQRALYNRRELCELKRLINNFKSYYNENNTL